MAETEISNAVDEQGDVIGQAPKQIEATNEKINKLVYELYGLSAEEIDVIEGEE